MAEHVYVKSKVYVKLFTNNFRQFTTTFMNCKRNETIRHFIINYKSLLFYFHLFFHFFGILSFGEYGFLLKDFILIITIYFQPPCFRSSTFIKTQQILSNLFLLIFKLHRKCFQDLNLQQILT